MTCQVSGGDTAASYRVDHRTARTDTHYFLRCESGCIFGVVGDLDSRGNQSTTVESEPGGQNESQHDADDES